MRLYLVLCLTVIYVANVKSLPLSTSNSDNTQADLSSLNKEATKEEEIINKVEKKIAEEKKASETSSSTEEDEDEDEQTLNGINLNKLFSYLLKKIEFYHLKMIKKSRYNLVMTMMSMTMMMMTMMMTMMMKITTTTVNTIIDTIKKETISTIITITAIIKKVIKPTMAHVLI